MGRPDLTRRFFRLAWINILSNVTVPLAGLVDTAMLGHLDDVRFLAGVGLGSILFDYVYWTFGFLRMGTTGTTAQAKGRGDARGVGLALYRPLLLALAIAAGLLLLKAPIRELGFALLQGAPGVEQAGRGYFDARIWGAPAVLCNFVLVGWFLGREQSRHVLAMTVAANLANIALNYLFIVRWGLAARGAGLATMASQYLMVGVGLALFARQAGRVRWSWPEVLHRERIVELLRLNGDILLRTICLVSSFAVFLNIGSMLGTTLLAANLILYRLFSLAAYLVDGAAFASESLAGVFRGEGDLSRLRRLVRLSLLSGVGFAGLFLAAFFLAPQRWLRLLTDHAEVIEIARSHAPWLVPVMLLGSIAFMYDGLFLGLTEGRSLRNAMLASTFLVFLPAAGFALHAGDNHLLWLALSLFMAARSASLAWELRRHLVAYAAW